MSFRTCEKGHHYDDSLFAACPQCAVSINNEEQINPPVRVKKITLSRRTEEADERTISYHSEIKGNNYVTGWLICSQGAEKGRDYRLHFGFNRVGASGAMDICVSGDREIAAKYHCAVVYDDKGNKFYICPGKGTITYVNGELLEKSRELSGYEVIEIGKTKLEFVPYCGGERKWQ